MSIIRTFNKHKRESEKRECNCCKVKFIPKSSKDIYCKECKVENESRI